MVDCRTVVSQEQDVPRKDAAVRLLFRINRLLGHTNTRGNRNCFGRRRKYHHTINATLIHGLTVTLTQLTEEGLSVS